MREFGDDRGVRLAATASQECIAPPDTRSREVDRGMLGAASRPPSRSAWATRWRWALLAEGIEAGLAARQLRVRRWALGSPAIASWSRHWNRRSAILAGAGDASANAIRVGRRLARCRPLLKVLIVKPLAGGNRRWSLVERGPPMRRYVRLLPSRASAPMLRGREFRRVTGRRTYDEPPDDGGSQSGAATPAAVALRRVLEPSARNRPVLSCEDVFPRVVSSLCRGPRNAAKAPSFDLLLRALELALLSLVKPSSMGAVVCVPSRNGRM